MKKLAISDYKQCKFYRDGQCIHEDAPRVNPTCIGKDACGCWHDPISFAEEEALKGEGK